MDNNIFLEIHTMCTGGITGTVMDCGAGNYNIKIEDVTFDNYVSYIATLIANGFAKYVDNSENGLEQSVWTSTYTKDELVVTVSYMAKRQCIYIAVGKNLALSPHLFYDEKYLKDNREDAKTSLHMLELHTFGDSFVIQLKNGHFILIDSGMPADALYLLDYLEEHVPVGEKPIIEGLFITHGHADHLGMLIAFANNPQYAERIWLEGIYFSEPSVDTCTRANALEQVQVGLKGFNKCRTSCGEETPIYRPQTGQRYYFNDLVIDVLHTQEQLPLENYGNGFNDSSTWLLFTIEGQTFLDGGDAGRGSIEVVKSTYEKEYLNFDIMTSFHHGQNVYETYVEYFDYTTVLYTTFVVGSQTAGHKTEENRIMQERARECMSWGNGTKILTFPYKVGEAQNLPMKKWIYHPDRKMPRPYTKE